ncbi:MAG: undecaprenyl/decaprenyl-phosphate alpha-N-acetylglucosaminyl 1-phosphate transferase, partial [Bdellovibrionales bacterium]|nr:undecaprenyl/decaprenyl-phosphate alpha-N-acetylglucosaminyl 1-phosphate transferase [Bdellovibrionales bacterium]
MPLVARIAPLIGAIDQPGERRLNRRAVPRLGGVAVFIGFHLGCALIFLPNWSPFAGELDERWWFSFLPASAILMLLGAIDDIRELRPLAKLAGQLMVAILLFFADFRFGRVLGIPLPYEIDFIVSTLWYLTLINAFNLIDGLDGLAAGLACIGAMGIAGAMVLLRQPADALVLVSLIGACLAFLRFNFYPARIFLGDSGSMFLGLTFATIAVCTSTKGTTVAVFGISILAAGVPLLDTLLAIWRRSVRK